MNTIKFTSLDPLAVIPQVSRTGDAGFDLRCLDAVRIDNEPQLVRTGVAVAIPEGHVGLVCSRSGLSLKQGVVVSNAPGVIDSNYRGELGLILHTIKPETTAYFGPGTRLAQLVVVPALTSSDTVSQLDDTNRGSEGFGSSGTT